VAAGDETPLVKAIRHEDSPSFMGLRDDDETPGEDESPDEGAARDENVVIGPSPGRIGSGNVFIRAGDGGDVRIGEGTAVPPGSQLRGGDGGGIHIGGGVAIGAGARADPTSVAIGAGAMAGQQLTLEAALEQLRELLKAAGRTKEASLASDLGAEVNRPMTPERAKRIKQLWRAVSVAATTNEAIALVHSIAPVIEKL
jgi:hypothetical protein